MSGSRASFPISLDDWLSDPLVQLVMQADKVDPAHIIELYRNLATQRADACRSSAEGTLAIEKHPSSEFRAGVGIMLLNQRDGVFVGRRIRTPGDAWQMPQGGIEEGEAPLTAALRELREEVGTDDVQVLAESKTWLRYELPQELIGKAWQGRWRGQQQKWFMMRYLGHDSGINVATEQPEFFAWRWVSASELPDLIVSFKRQVYLEVLRQFAPVAPEPGDVG